ncbi:uncharacterized protein LOC130380635 [Gadus chalcogrammus]|uniref:uncharacterized protein LOC130380635 n=1 Tax=Gadus chalcogrammus TaxID=1042646 RepID=UPI0024C2647D|nr:uncharacterized protein LOC130380635 [Gadus chalcogrammus]
MISKSTITGRHSTDSKRDTFSDPSGSTKESARQQIRKELRDNYVSTRKSLQHSSGPEDTRQHASKQKNTASATPLMKRTKNQAMRMPSGWPQRNISAEVPRSEEKDRVPELEEEPPSGLKPGDQVYLKGFRRRYKVTNATQTFFQVEGSATWYHLSHCTRAAQPRTREQRVEEREKEPDADMPGADQLPQDQTQPSQEQQLHDDAENGELAPDPLRVGPDSTGSRTGPEEG